MRETKVLEAQILIPDADALPEFLAIGNITRDVQGDSFFSGGSSLYSAYTARAMGVSSAIISSVGNDFYRKDVFKNIRLHLSYGRSMTIFRNVYTDVGRQQYVISLAKNIAVEHIPDEWKTAGLVHICPVFGEVDARILDFFKRAVVCVTPQGWMRGKLLFGKVVHKQWKHAEKILNRTNILILSEEDIRGFEDDLEFFKKLVGIVVLTLGSGGSILYFHGKEHHFPAYPTSEVDPTGAGDVFASAFLIHYGKYRDPYLASKFATCAASFSVEAVALYGIKERNFVADRLRNYNRFYSPPS